MIDISITIVAYNDEVDVRNAVCSILEHTAVTISKKIYIVDNSTKENTLSFLAKEYKDVDYQKPEKNLGFGGGHNYVLNNLNSKYHAIVNPDILLTEDSFLTLMGFLEKTGAGMVVPRLTDEQGELQSVYRREPTLLDMAIRMFFPSLFKKRQSYHTMQDLSLIHI